MRRLVYDTNGDVYLTFPCSIKQVQAPTGDRITAPDGTDIACTEKSHGRCRPIQLQVTSRVLKSTSRVWRAMLSNEDMAEALALKSTGSVNITLPEDNPPCFVHVMEVIYGTIRRLSKTDALTLARISTIVDKYEFHEAMERAAMTWYLQFFPSEIPRKFNNDMILWLWISWVFRDHRVFTILTATCQMEAKGPIANPIAKEIWLPQVIIDGIEQRRLDALTRIHSLFVSKIAEEKRENERLGSSLYEAWLAMFRPLRAFRIGYLVLEASRVGIPCPLTAVSPKQGFDGVSFQDVSSKLKDMDDPDNITLGTPSIGSYLPRVIDILGTFVPVFGRVLAQTPVALGDMAHRSHIKQDFHNLLRDLENELWGLDLTDLI
ncbi:hypothetical protein BDV59DRAFT_71370 [Aspergillus ambiguus]|uniref:uncharacterized protein n=1 Tax=Aspergillus ambiguus TaxID=176160 RepID=UPI003CCD2512